MSYQTTPGMVYFIGAGAGAPDLITIRGRDIIAQAGLILYTDRLASEGAASLNRRPETRVVATSTMSPNEIVSLMVAAARAGEVVARVHSGSPALYRASDEQMAALRRASVPYEVVPGVPAGHDLPSSAEAVRPGRTTIARSPWPSTYPITLIGLAGAPVVVVGGGAVGERKVAGLLEASAAVRLVSPAATERLRGWAEGGRISWEQRPFASGDLAGAYLAFAATDRREVNAQVASEARERGILCNVADAPAEGSFHLPAVYRGSDTLVAVSTAGSMPGRAAALRDAIARWLAAGAQG